MRLFPKILLWLGFVVAVATAAGGGVYLWQHNQVEYLDSQLLAARADLETTKRQALAERHAYASQQGVDINIYIPVASQRVSNPVIIMGEAPGNWSFEGSFPIKLLNAKGEVIAQTTASLQQDWMTDEMVPFTAKLSFSAPAGHGTLVLHKDNPSGLATKEDSVSIPVEL